MMLCAADFEELMAPARRPARRNDREPLSPGRACLDRWEDDGGLTHRIPSVRRAGPRNRARSADSEYDPMRVGFAFAMMPAAGFLGAASTMTSIFHQLTRS